MKDIVRAILEGSDPRDLLAGDLGVWTVDPKNPLRFSLSGNHGLRVAATLSSTASGATGSMAAVAPDTVPDRNVAIMLRSPRFAKVRGVWTASTLAPREMLEIMRKLGEVPEEVFKAFGRFGKK